MPRNFFHRQAASAGPVRDFLLIRVGACRSVTELAMYKSFYTVLYCVLGNQLLRSHGTAWTSLLYLWSCRGT
eukprot:1599858-Rhodomonas_salina.3